VSLCPISLFNILHQMSFYDILSLIRLHLNSDKHVLLTSKIPYAFYNFTSKFTYYVHKTLMHLSCHHMRSHFNFQHYKGMIKTPPIVVCVGNKSPWKRRLWWFWGVHSTTNWWILNTMWIKRWQWKLLH
jgi:hypothetical protein